VASCSSEHSRSKVHRPKGDDCREWRLIFQISKRISTSAWSIRGTSSWIRSRHVVVQIEPQRGSRYYGRADGIGSYRFHNRGWLGQGHFGSKPWSASCAAASMPGRQLSPAASGTTKTVHFGRKVRLGLRPHWWHQPDRHFKERHAKKASVAHVGDFKTLAPTYTSSKDFFTCMVALQNLRSHTNSYRRSGFSA